jgi:hypothetical protein
MKKIERVMTGKGPAFSSYQRPLILHLDSAVKESEDIDGFLNKVVETLFYGIHEIAGAGARAIQEKTLERLLGEYRPGPFMMLNKNATRQPILEAFTERIVPLMFLEPQVMYGGRGQISLGIFDLNALAEIDATDLVQLEVSVVTTFEQDDVGIMEAGAKQEGFGIRGGGRSIGGTRGESEFVHVWQMIEFGTGIFSQHPSYGWVPRDEGAVYKKDGSPIKVPDGGGAWHVGPGGPIALGQKGGHFLFGVRQSMQFAAEDYRVAVKAITQYINQTLGLVAKDQPAKATRRKRTKG